MKTRIITALGILAFIIPALYYGGWLLFALISLIIFFGGREYLGLSPQTGSWPLVIRLLVIFSAFTTVFCPFNHWKYPLLGVWMLFFMAVPVFSKRYDAKDALMCISYLSFFTIIGSSFLMIYTTNPLYIWLIIIATYCCDTAAYFCGYLWGRHKLNPRISPKKTVEGSIGGWLFGAVCAFAFAYFVIPDMAIGEMVAAAVLLPFSGQVGDLAFSALKRSFGIKDFSHLLPGHGGVLDRLDSLIFNFICFYGILAVMVG